MAKPKVAYKFDPFELVGKDKDNFSRSQRNQILEQVGDYVVSSVLDDCDSSRSPVTGRGFKKLSQTYAKKKKAQVGTTAANLKLDGDLLGSLEVKKSGGMLTLTVGSDQQGKADGHNNFSGDSNLPTRKFIPNDSEGETFRPGIRQGIREIIEALEEDE